MGSSKCWHPYRSHFRWCSHICTFWNLHHRTQKYVCPDANWPLQRSSARWSLSFSSAYPFLGSSRNSHASPSKCCSRWTIRCCSDGRRTRCVAPLDRSIDPTIGGFCLRPRSQCICHFDKIVPVSQRHHVQHTLVGLRSVDSSQRRESISHCCR